LCVESLINLSPHPFDCHLPAASPGAATLLQLLSPSACSHSSGALIPHPQAPKLSSKPADGCYCSSPPATP
jgi:hypothetical protein